MSRVTFLVAIVLAAFLGNVNAECANACNGHGKCVGYDMCICNRNWQANDCSERVCMHGLAHVDTPKGDLDMSGNIATAISGIGNAGSTNPHQVVVDNSFQYPYGTTEQFPQMQDSDLNVLQNSAHYYMECSNKGTCDRSTGECECFDGYDGVACQRASCPGYPNSCSGHGVCKSAKQLANSDNGNVYKLWNKDATMGCECDSGYYGADCSQKNCKVGVDPLYLDDSSTIRYSVFDVATLVTGSTIDFDDGTPSQKQGTFALRFFDHTGEDWVTAPIVAGSPCWRVVAALEGIPNDVIPKGSVYCTRTEGDDADDNSGWSSTVDDGANDGHKNTLINYRMSIWDAYTYGTHNGNTDALNAQTELGNDIYSPLMWTPGSFTLASGSSATAGTEVDGATRAKLSGYIYRLKFYGNPGKLREPEVITHLDGKRNSLMSTTYHPQLSEPAVNRAVITKVWTDGRAGENKDYFADHCDGVTVTIGINAAGLTGGNADKANTASDATYTLTPANTDQIALLKKCLGDSDATSTNNVDIYDWDTGDEDYPHLVKLVRTVTTSTDGGYYVALIFTGGVFKMLNPFVPPDAIVTDTYEVYTTKGTLSRVSRQAQVHFGFGSKYAYSVSVPQASYTAGNSELWDGDLSCEVGDNNGFRVTPSTYTTSQLSSVAQHGSSVAMSTLIGNPGVNGNNVDVFINDVVTEWTYDYNVQPSKRLATKFYKNCLNKTDIITFINPSNVNFNAPNLNLYTVDRLVSDKSVWSNAKRFSGDCASFVLTADALLTAVNTGYAAANDLLGGAGTYSAAINGVTGTGAIADVTIDAAGLITAVTVTSPGKGYANGDIVNFALNAIGGVGAKIDFTLVAATHLNAGCVTLPAVGYDTLTGVKTEDQARKMSFGTNVINLDISTNWGTDIGIKTQTDLTKKNVSPYYVYKFVPHADSTYEYVAECANRGICDRDSGICECFPGYTNDNCDTQSSIAL